MYDDAQAQSEWQSDQDAAAEYAMECEAAAAEQAKAEAENNEFESSSQPLPMSLEQRCQELAELKKTLDLEGAERAKVRYGEEFTALSKQIEALVEKQNELLDPLPNSQAEYDDLAKEVIDMMKDEQVYSCGAVSAKFKEKNEVNTSKVLSVIGGDMDIFVSLANITQSRLKEFAKSSGLKKELMDCVETVSRDVVELVVSQPSAA